MAATVLAGATSCSDFLEEENKTGNTADLIYGSESGLSIHVMPTPELGGARSLPSDCPMPDLTFGTQVPTTSRCC